MKKILVLNYEFPPLGGGGGVATHKLAKGFIENGYKVDVITTWFKGLKKYEVVDGINIYRVKVLGRKELPTASMISMLCYPVSGFFVGLKLCKKYKYDFINTQFVVPTGPLGLILSKIFKIKNILSLHGGDIYDPSKKTSPHKSFIFRKIVKFLLNKADFIVAQSSNTKENTIKYYNPKKDIKIIPLPYESFSFNSISKKELGLDENKKYIIGVGRLVKRKAFDIFIKALYFTDDNVCGLIIGDGPEGDYLYKISKDLKIDSRITFLGQVSEEKKFQYLSNSDIFILSSLHEGFGIVLQEAMQVGLPIIATNNGGQIDLVEDNKNGFLVKVGDVKEIADKIKFILDNNDIFNNIKSNNINKSKEFDIKLIAERYIELV